MEIDGQEQKETLFGLIMGTQSRSNQNNVIKFCDNSRWSPAAVCVRVCVFASRGLIVMKNVFSSGIQGAELECVFPRDPSRASPYETRRSLRHVIFTAETHNFPTGHRRKKQTSASCWFFVTVV